PPTLPGSFRGAWRPGGAAPPPPRPPGCSSLVCPRFGGRAFLPETSRALRRRAVVVLARPCGLPRRGLDAGAVPELRAASDRFRRVPLPGLPFDGERRRDRSRLLALARSRARRGCPHRGSETRARARDLQLPHATNFARELA